jgi:hypothetical protein
MVERSDRLFFILGTSTAPVVEEFHGTGNEIIVQDPNITFDEMGINPTTPPD